MRTIAFVTQKGGSGKSTLASSLAVTAHEAGERVFIIDLDPQKSLVMWSQTRGEADVPVEAVAPAKLTSVIAALEKSGVTLCIIDTAGAETATTKAAMKAADLCIIPSRPNVFDHLTSDCCGSRSMMNTRSPASMAVTASDEASVLLPEPPFCVTNAMVRMFIPSDGFWKW